MPPGARPDVRRRATIRDPDTAKVKTLEADRDNLFKRVEILEALTNNGGLPLWAELNSGAGTAADDVWLPINFRSAIKTSADPSNAVFDWVITDDGDPGNDRFELIFVAPGVYMVDCVAVWDQVLTNGAQDGFAVIALNPYNTADNAVTDDSYRESHEWLTICDAACEMRDNPFTRVSGIFYATGNNRWRPEGKQTTGVDRGLGGQYFRAVYLGPQGNNPIFDDI